MDHSEVKEGNSEGKKDEEKEEVTWEGMCEGINKERCKVKEIQRRVDGHQKRKR